MTFNVLDYTQAEPDRRLRVAAEGLRGLRPDVVALQEAPAGRGAELVRELLGEEYDVERRS